MLGSFVPSYFQINLPLVLLYINSVTTVLKLKPNIAVGFMVTRHSHLGEGHKAFSSWRAKPQKMEAKINNFVLQFHINYFSMAL